MKGEKMGLKVLTVHVMLDNETAYYQKFLVEDAHGPIVNAMRDDYFVRAGCERVLFVTASLMASAAFKLCAHSAHTIEGKEGEKGGVGNGQG